MKFTRRASVSLMQAVEWLRRRAIWNGLYRLVQLHPPVVLIIRATPAECVRTLVAAARPSQERLHLRNLFVEGRRYYIEPRKDGFRLTSNSKLPWGGRRRRTPVTASLAGTVSAIGDNLTAVRLHVYINWFYILRGMLLPAWMSAIIVFSPWPPLIVIALVLALFALAWLGHRYNSALQAHEMIFFVEKALDDLPAGEIPELAPAGAEVVDHPGRQDFRAQWEKFYQEHR